MTLFPKTVCWLLLATASFPGLLGAQSKDSPSLSPPALSEQQEAGRGLFLQNCALCHLTVRGNKKDPKNRTAGPTIAPRLNGRMRGEKPLTEDVLRTFIQEGVANKMPAFKYALEPKEVDAILAYLKTL